MLIPVNAMHITASVFINDDERGLHQDCDDSREELAPHEPVSKYRHNRTGEDNADAHMKRQIMGRDAKRWWRPLMAVWTTRLSSPKSLARWSRCSGPASMAGTRVLMGGGASGCWSRSLESKRWRYPVRQLILALVG